MSKRKRRTTQSTAPVRPVTPSNQRSLNQPEAVSLNWKQVCPAIFACAGFFLVVCFSVPGLIKGTALAMLLVVIAVLAVSREFGTRLNWLTIAVTLWVAWNGCSTLYGVARKFALYEFLKLAIAFGIFVLVLAFGRRGAKDMGRTSGTAVEVGGALASLLSIDFISTRVLSSIFFLFMGMFTQNYEGMPGIEVGVRMTSIFENPNIFAGCAGIGVLLSLGLATTAPTVRSRNFHLICLAISSLGFILAFSMGGSGMIALAFLAYLALERREGRGRLLLLMIETLIVTMAAAFPIYMTSFDTWVVSQPVPLACAILSAAALCVIDYLVGRRLAEKLAGQDKLVFGLIGLVLAAVAIYGVLAYNIAGATSLASGESLRRSAYPDPGTYTLTVEADSDLTVVIESQNQQDAMMHTSTVLYSGAAQGAEFTVPEGSIVVYFNFTAEQNTQFDSAVYRGDSGEGSLRLGYKLLPGFMANRLQGLFANENAIQRIVFFEDGMKLFRRSPIIGLGLGTFENSLYSVQDFYYETRYTHNHYIQALIDTGVVGLLLFLAVLGLAAAAVLRARWKGGDDISPLTASLGAALVFMAGHAAVEVVFSSNFYLPFALAVLGLISLCCGEYLPAMPLKRKGRTRARLVMALPVAVYAVLLIGNLYARHLFSYPYYDALERAVLFDVFEDLDYMASYTYGASSDENRDALTSATMEHYLTRMDNSGSNTATYYLAASYFNLGRTEKAFEALDQYTDTNASSQDAWRSAFQLAIQNSEGSEAFLDGISQLYQKMLDWDAEHIGSITLDAETETIVTAILNSL